MIRTADHIRTLAGRRVTAQHIAFNRLDCICPKALAAPMSLQILPVISASKPDSPHNKRLYTLLYPSRPFLSSEKQKQRRLNVQACTAFLSVRKITRSLFQRTTIQTRTYARSGHKRACLQSYDANRRYGKALPASLLKFRSLYHVYIALSRERFSIIRQKQKGEIAISPFLRRFTAAANPFSRCRDPFFQEISAS